MEYVDGKTLRDILRSDGPLSRQVMTWMADVAAAMDFSHRNGIVHRDMKPTSMLIDITGAVKVMDFGIARAMNDSASAMTQTSAVMGTAQYCQRAGQRHQVDPRSGIYSMGCVLFELLTGQPPFAATHRSPSPTSTSTRNRRCRRRSGGPAANWTRCSSDEQEPRQPLPVGGRPACRPRQGARRRQTVGADGAQRGRTRPPRHRAAAICGPTAGAAVESAAAPTRWRPTSRSSRRRPLLILGTKSCRGAGIAGRRGSSCSGRRGTPTRPRRSPCPRSTANPPPTPAPSSKPRASGPNASARPASTSTPARSPGPHPAPASRPTTARVTLYVSTGPQRQPIPDVHGKTQDEAQKALDVLGFTNVKLDTVDSTRFGSSRPPRPRAPETPVNSAVGVFIGTGPKMVTIPEINGLQRVTGPGRARTERPADVQHRADSGFAKGNVINSSPGAGTTVMVIGTTVRGDRLRGNQYTVPDVS